MPSSLSCSWSSHALGVQIQDTRHSPTRLTLVPALHSNCNCLLFRHVVCAPVLQNLSFFRLLTSGVFWALITTIPLTRMYILLDVWDTLKEEEVALKVRMACWTPSA